MKQQNFTIKNRLKSFGYAFNGLKILVQKEHNSWIYLLAKTCVIIAGFYYKVSILDWIALVFAIGFVFAMEIFNTAIEHVANFISPEKNDKIKQIKDLSAAGVLVSAATALIIGLLVFLPKIL